MTKDELLHFSDGDFLPPKNYDEIVTFLNIEFDIQSLNLSLIPKWRLELIQKSIKNCILNQKLNIPAPRFEFSLFQIVPNEKSIPFYQSFHARANIHVLIEQNTTWCLSDCPLLTTILFITRGISEQDILYLTPNYLVYQNYFDILKDQLQELETSL